MYFSLLLINIQSILDCILISVSFFCVPLGLIIQIGVWKEDNEKYILKETHKAVSQVNTILSDEKVLMGCHSHSKMSLVYVSLDSCKREFAKTFSEMAVTEEMFQRALIFFSSGYTCCLAKRHFQIPQPSSTGHLEGGVSPSSSVEGNGNSNTSDLEEVSI